MSAAERLPGVPWHDATRAAAAQMPAEDVGQAAQPMVTDPADRGPHCPTTQQQCEVLKATVVHDGQTGSVPVDLPRAVSCNPAAVVSQPNAPPMALLPHLNIVAPGSGELVELGLALGQVHPDRTGGRVRHVVIASEHDFQQGPSGRR
ncbi:hypothetical protein [Streptomyces sp. NPDC018833]|uniref:hypothetical protein n=1 Tax=Streptomyces sp. NPDC018833 TaxID=3365053 RepID=UPI003797A375